MGIIKNIVLDVFCNDFIKQFYLPDQLEGRFYLNLYAYETKEHENISIPLDASGGVWSVTSKRYKIYTDIGSHHQAHGASSASVGLTVGKKIALINKGTKILIYVKKNDSQNLRFKKYYCGGMYEITIGRGTGNTIIIDHDFISERHAVIRFENGKAYIKDANSRHGVYQNGRSVKHAELKNGDVIYIMGVRIVFLNTLIAINNPDEIVTCQMYPYDGARRRTSLSEAYVDDKADYFKRSPRILEKLETGEETITPPPQPKVYQPTPLHLRLIAPMGMIVAMVVSLLAMSGNNSRAMQIARVVMIAVMVLSAIVVPILMERFQERKNFKEENERRFKYLLYLREVIKNLEEKQQFNRDVLNKRYPSNKECARRCLENDRRLWERIPENEDFLEVKLGTGTAPFSVGVSVNIDDFNLIDDPLREHALKTMERFQFIEKVPITVSILREPIIGIIGRRSNIVGLVKSVMLQLCTLHCYTELKFAFFYEQDEEEEWSFVKWLPHTWTSDKKLRFVGTRHSEVNEIMQYLDSKLSVRQASSDELPLPHFVVFIMSRRLVENEPLIRSFIEKRGAIGLTLIYIQDTLDMLPQSCNLIIQNGSVYKNDGSSNDMTLFTPETEDGIPFGEIAISLFKTKVYDNFESSVLKDMLTFLGMYNVPRIEALNITTRWLTNLTYNSISAPIGLEANGSLFSLDIHEKAHGPHGLVAGTTGSGKSEFIQSFILSMAINYHPYDVSFILIDFKGGGMANLFKKLPHVSGVLTNLEGNQKKRSLASLESELKRRQTIFAECGVNHIDQYQKYFKSRKVQKPLPHLVIISDEFAELKQKQPEFMGQLVETARIGRSLGVHLILATQKPAGVVDAQISSNTTFRVCLKVNDKGDSQEMLGRPEAANITVPGRAYVKVGNNEVFVNIQSGWSGAPYIPKDELEDEEQKGITLIDNCARQLRKSSLDEDLAKSDKSQLEAIVDYITEISGRTGIEPLELWLPPLPSTIYFNEIADASECFDGERWQTPKQWLAAPVGIIDDTKKQAQPPLYVDFGKNGSAALYGVTSSGKSTFVQTLVYAMAMRYSPDAVNMYILDFASRTMRYCKELPHVADVLFTEDEAKLRKLFKMLTREIEERKNIFSGLGVNNLKSYNQIKREEDAVLPAILIIVNNYSVLAEQHSWCDDQIGIISRDGSGYGVYLFLTAAATSAIKVKITHNLKAFYALQLSDKYEYQNVLGVTNNLEPERNPGRGLIRADNVVEYQTALSIEAENDSDRVLGLKRIFAEMNMVWKGAVPSPVPVVPESYRIEESIRSVEYTKLLTTGQIPIGYDIDEVEICSIPSSFFSFAVLGNQRKGKTNFLHSFMELTAAMGWRIYVLDNEASTLRKHAKNKNCAQYANNKTSFDQLMEQYIQIMQNKRIDQKAGMDTDEIIAKYGQDIFIVDNASYFVREASPDKVDALKSMLRHCSGTGTHFVFAETPQSLTDIRNQELLTLMFNPESGVLLGGKFDDQRIFTQTIDPKHRGKAYDPGIGYLFQKGAVKRIKTPHFTQ